MTTLAEMIDRLPEERRRKVEALTEELLAEELLLRALREARRRTQRRIGAKLAIDPEEASRLGQRSDQFLSTFRDCVEEMGGTLQLVAKFPDQPPVALKGITTLSERIPASGI